jgi:heme O synthase-like polyprenyltransferase
VAVETGKPAFYALRGGGWRDYVTLLHPPYTAWHLSYVAIGAALAPSLQVSRLLPALAAFFLAVGVGAHALDELNGRPLGTTIPRSLLIGGAVTSIAAAAAIGLLGALTVNAWIALFVAAGVFIVVAYNLELVGGRFHSDFWFAAAWGAFPLLTGYFAVAERITLDALLAALFALALSLAQRRLSTWVRHLRRRVARVAGTIERTDGSDEEVTKEALLGPAEGALRALTTATVALAAALVMMRLA